MKRLAGALVFLMASQIPVLGSVVYTFSSGSGTSAIGFTAILPNYLNLAVGESDVIPGNALSSCSIGLPPGGPNFCSSIRLSRTTAGGDVAMSAASIFEPDLTVPVAPDALFPNLTFAESGTFAGTVQGVNIPAIFSIQATPEPSTITGAGLALALLAFGRRLIRFRS